MRIDAVKINNESQLIADYRNNKETIMKFFDYHPFQTLEKRVEELKEREFKRDELVAVLEECNTAWGAGEATIQAINQLNNPESVVVVGGQQAGLLTGPLYSINKVISILQFAKEQEEKLGIQVLPVFWIAGEDHDYEEVNHVFLPDKKQMKKYKFKQSLDKKAPISEVVFDEELALKWIDELFGKLPETIHTKEIYSLVREAQQQSKSITDFFATMIHKLFKEEGIILLDAAHPAIRRMESEYFVRLIENLPKISHEMVHTSNKLIECGYTPALDLDPLDGHLFYHLNGERILLKRTGNGNWIGKQEEVELTTEQLLEIAWNQPEQLSNNVATRPLMQELLLPTLAFIGGPGEISYWSLLKPAFHSLNLNMPPVVPRLSFTYVPHQVRKALDATGIDIHTALHEGSGKQKKEWIRNKQEPPIDELAKELKKTIETAHQPIRDVALSIRDDIGALAEKNLTYLHREIDFLKKRMNQALEEKYEKELQQFDLIELILHPENGLQERTWNPLPFLNEYGTEVLTMVTRSSCSFEEQHYIVYL